MNALILQSMRTARKFFLSPSIQHCRPFKSATSAPSSEPTAGESNPASGVQKQLYNTSQVFMQKAINHFNEGDFAQSAEKLYGVFQFCLKQYVNQMCKQHGIKIDRDRDRWDYYKYKCTCEILDGFVTKYWKQKVFETFGDTKNDDVAKFLNDFVAKLESDTFFAGSWGIAKNDYHVRGWKRNELNSKEVANGIRTMQIVIDKIEQLPHDREIIVEIVKEVFTKKQSKKKL